LSSRGNRALPLEDASALATSSIDENRGGAVARYREPHQQCPNFNRKVQVVVERCSSGPEHQVSSQGIRGSSRCRSYYSHIDDFKLLQPQTLTVAPRVGKRQPDPPRGLSARC